MKLTTRLKSLAGNFARRLTRESDRFPMRTRKRILVAAILLAAGQCLFMMLEPFVNSHDRTTDLHADKISTALVPGPADNLAPPRDTVMLNELKDVMDCLRISNKETFWQRIKRKRALLDSVSSFVFNK